MSKKESRSYVGLKIVEAWPQVKPGDGVGRRGEDGYALRYPDGYESWSPRKTFEEAYREVHGITFSIALEACFRGAGIYRRGWNGVRNGVRMSVVAQYPTERSLMTEPYLYLVTERSEGDDVVMTRIPWVASQGDLFAEDWVIEWPATTD